MTVESREDKIVGEIDIEATPEAVFDAIVTPSELEQWWGADEVYRTFDWQVDLRPGGAWICQTKSPAGAGPPVHGKYLEVDRPRVLAYTWNPGWEENPAETVVRITLTPIESGTRLRVEHSGFGDRKKSQLDHEQGWPMVLEWLSNFCKQKESLR